MPTYTNRTGFTLVETLVAISVLMLAIMGPMVIAAQGLRNSFIARDQIIAFYLAQESVEIVRYWRDTNALSGASWLAGIDGSCSTDGCGVRVGNLAAPFASCGSLNNCRMYYDEGASGRAKYSHDASGGVPTPFTRTLRIVGSGSIEREVIAVVRWSTPVGERQVTVRTRIFNQYDNL